MTALAVKCERVTKHYPEFDLKGIDLELPEGQVMGFIGPNGAGKSTTIRILMGLVHQDSGSVEVLGYKMPDAQSKAKLDIGYVSEDLRLYPGATVGWHMDFIASIYPGWKQSYAEDLLRRFELKAGQKIKGLSHGQRVKATLLLALARFPKLLILDEPTTGLDPVARQEVLSAFMEVLADEERTILFSSHNTQDVEQLSDHITFIDRGQVIASCDKESFLDKWKRVRVALPEGGQLPPLTGIRQQQASGRLAVLTMDSFNGETIAALEAQGAEVQGVEHMTLEEIFLADIASSRGRVAQ